MTLHFIPTLLTIGTQLRKLRLARKMTQRQIAEETGINLVTINRIEKGLNNITFETLQKICIALNADLQIRIKLLQQIR